MPSRPQISVLLPARNARRWVVPAVRDLLRQVDVALEVVAVDDGSTDGTGAALHALARREPRLRVLFSPSAGPAEALNRALEAARAPLIGHMEADDRCPPRRFALLLAALREHGWDGAVSRAGLLGFRTAGMRRYLDWQNRLLEPAELARERFVEIPALHQSGLYHRALLDRVGGYRDTEWPLDIDFWMRVYEHRGVVGKVPRVLYHWRQHAGQSTRTSPRHTLASLRRCKAHYFLRGPARGRRLELYSVGRTLGGWTEELLRQGRKRQVHATPWTPSDEIPPRCPGSVRLFLFGMPQVRRGIAARIPDLDPDLDWFAA